MTEGEAEASTDTEAQATESTSTGEAEADATSAEGEAEATGETSAETEDDGVMSSEDEDMQAGDAGTGSATSESEADQDVTDADGTEESAAGETGESDAQAEDATGDEATGEAGAETSGEAEASGSSDAENEAAMTQQDSATAAAAAGEGEAEGEVTTETLTEENVRSSDEDFETSVTSSGEEGSEEGGDDASAEGSAQAEAESAEDDDDDQGISNFQKALALGLGAVAVGSMLNNGSEVVSNSGDRVVVQGDDGNLRVLKNDDALLRQAGSQVQTETFNDGSTRTTVTREDGSQIVTIRAADGRVLRRTRVLNDGTRVQLFDDTAEQQEVDVASLPAVDESQQQSSMSDRDEEALRQALMATQSSEQVGRTFSLSQVRNIREVRALAPQVELDAITFDTGSAAIRESQAQDLADLGLAISDIVQERPGAVFLIEGHTDAVGDAAYNLALSDRRAESVALALSEYFDVPPENLVTQGYGESNLKVETTEAERQNRRAVVRNISGLLN